MRQFSDEDLTSFLDGEADAKLSHAIELALSDDPEIAGRVSALHVDKDELKRAFGGLLEAAPQMPDTRPARQTGSILPSGFLKIAAAAVLALGIGWTFGNKGSELTEWQDYAAAYHKLYVEETLQPADFSTDALNAQLMQVSSAVGLAISPEQLQTHGSLELKRSQVLGFNGSAIGHIAFQSADGNPVALCISRGSGTRDIAFAETLGMRGARWSKGGFDYLLIGGTDAKLIERAAQYFQTL